MTDQNSDLQEFLNIPLVQAIAEATDAFISRKQAARKVQLMLVRSIVDMVKAEGKSKQSIDAVLTIVKTSGSQRDVAAVNDWYAAVPTRFLKTEKKDGQQIFLPKSRPCKGFAETISSDTAILAEMFTQDWQDFRTKKEPEKKAMDVPLRVASFLKGLQETDLVTVDYDEKMIYEISDLAERYSNNLDTIGKLKDVRITCKNNGYLPESVPLVSTTANGTVKVQNLVEAENANIVHQLEQTKKANVAAQDKIKEIQADADKAAADAADEIADLKRRLASAEGTLKKKQAAQKASKARKAKAKDKGEGDTK